jgi:CheY-like chemotaxis protein
MTASVFKEDVENCLAAGMNDHIGKPIEFPELIRKMKVYLLRR